METLLCEALFDSPPSVKQSLGDMDTQVNKQKHERMVSKAVRERKAEKSNKIRKHCLRTKRIMLRLQNVAECSKTVKWKCLWKEPPE